MNYKFESDAPEEIKKELFECAVMVEQLDDRMLVINDKIQRARREESIWKID
jgi:putative GTP pyrophosphokinase